MEPTGAMAATATTSPPERAGGDRNYDHRYGWIRDTSFVLDSFSRLSCEVSVRLLDGVNHGAAV